MIHKPSRSLKLLQLPQQLCTLPKHPGLLQPIRPPKHFCVRYMISGLHVILVQYDHIAKPSP